MSQRVGKICKHCGTTFFRHPKHSIAQWQNIKCCSKACANKARSTHGLRHTRLYRVWASIKNRCLNPNNHLYPDYGGRGITICREWRNDFAVFAAYMGADPGRGWDVGRIKNHRGYRPGNVEWQTESRNARNKRSTFWVRYQGKRICLADACERAGIPYQRVWQRMRLQGLTADEALR